MKIRAVLIAAALVASGLTGALLVRPADPVQTARSAATADSTDPVSSWNFTGYNGSLHRTFENGSGVDWVHIAYPEAKNPHRVEVEIVWEYDSDADSSASLLFLSGWGEPDIGAIGAPCYGLAHVVSTGSGQADAIDAFAQAGGSTVGAQAPMQPVYDLLGEPGWAENRLTIDDRESNYNLAVEECGLDQPTSHTVLVMTEADPAKVTIDARWNGTPLNMTWGGDEDVFATWRRDTNTTAGVGAYAAYAGVGVDVIRPVVRPNRTTFVGFNPNGFVGWPVYRDGECVTCTDAWVEHPNGTRFDIPNGSFLPRVTRAEGPWRFHVDGEAYPFGNLPPAVLGAAFERAKMFWEE